MSKAQGEAYQAWHRVGIVGYRMLMAFARALPTEALAVAL